MIDQDTIFLLGEEGRLDKIPHRRYETEDLLQSLVTDYPELLVGEQIDPDKPPRWLMVQREAGIPDSDGGHDRWAIDHVLLDQHGRPTLVEVKRSTDTRIRREVVGQLLDYAANARKYWPKERIRELAEKHCGGAEELQDRLRVLLGGADADIEAFWTVVDRNLREGELRLLFVADEIPTELRRIIEFLNEQMPRIEVLGIEIRQYERQGTRILVPRVIGQTAQAEDQKISKSSRVWAIDEVLEHFKNSGPFNSRVSIQQLLDWAGNESAVKVEPGTGSINASLRVRMRFKGRLVTLMTFAPAHDGSIIGAVYFGTLINNVECFEELEIRKPIADEIRDKVDENLSVENIDKFPSFRVASEEAMSTLIEICEGIVALTRAHLDGTPEVMDQR